MAAPLDSTGLFEAAPCGLALLDNGYVVRAANAYFCDLVGLAPGEAAEGLRFHARLSVAGRIFLQTRLQQELALVGRVEELALDVVRPDGTRVPVMLNAAQQLTSEGAPGDIHLAVWRAVAKRAYEAEVPKAREAAAVAARVKADFLANVSHEIRTPLNGVIGVAELLSGTSLAANQREMVEMIRASGATLERLVSDILELSKVQAGGLTLEPHPFDLQHELGGVIDMARLRAEEKRIAFAAEIAPEAQGGYLADAVRVKQILGNLTDNAVKFTSQGFVRVSIARRGDGALQFDVADSGIGFDETQADTLFARFEQAETGITRRFGGTGLGLAMCKSLVELMGGSIAARSRQGEGSVFSVVLPLPRTDAAPPASSPQQDLAERPLRVLLVEDNQVNQRVVQMILTQVEVQLDIAGNGAIGVEAWRDGAFDLVLMDMQMPVMDGLTAIRTIRGLERDQSRPRTPIAVLSANAMEHHRAEALAAGADMHIAKPVTPQGLLAGLQTLLTLNEAAAA